MVELADTRDLKSRSRDRVGVQVPLPAPFNIYMFNKNIQLALKILYEFLSEAEIPWILSGSASLNIQEVNVLPSPDIDILVSKNDIYKVDKILKKYRTKDLEKSYNSKYKSYYSTYLINNINIDLMADFQYKKRDGTWSKPVPTNKYNIVEYNGMQLRLLPLEQELKEYYETGRTERYKKIKEVLS